MKIGDFVSLVYKWGPVPKQRQRTFYLTPDPTKRAQYEKHTGVIIRKFINPQIGEVIVINPCTRNSVISFSIMNSLPDKRVVLMDGEVVDIMYKRHLIIEKVSNKKKIHILPDKIFAWQLQIFMQ